MKPAKQCQCRHCKARRQEERKEREVGESVEMPTVSAKTLSNSAYTQKVLELMDAQREIILTKEKQYGDTWKEEGIDGQMFNIIRKFRRLWYRVMQRGTLPDREDTLDLANYVLFLQALSEVAPKSLDKLRVRGIKGIFE